MKVGVLKARLAWIFILLATLPTTSFEAKLGLYHPMQSQAHLISKTFKISECRLERAVPDSPVIIAREVLSAPAEVEQNPDPVFEEYSPGPPAPVPLSGSHFFRPPPPLC